MLKKKEIIYREILARYLEKQENIFTQLELSRKFSISLSTVSNALSPLRSMGAIEVRQRSFRILDAKKVLLYWATVRNLDRDIIYSTRCEISVSEIEKLLPSGCVYTAYSAFRFLYKETPADYSEVYIYAPPDAIQEIRLRFPQSKGPPNLLVLEADPFICKGIASSIQIFVDLWNIRSWYAKEFLNALETRLFG